MRCHCICLAGLLLACTGQANRPQPAPDAGSELPYSIAASELPRGRELIPYSARIMTAGEAPAGLQWVVAEGSLPEGLRLDAAGAGAVEIVGAPQHDGTFTFSLAAVAADGRRALRGFSLLVDPAMSIEGALADGIEGEPYAATLTLVNFNGPPVQWSAVPGTLPPGLVLEGHGAVATLTGAPPAGRFDINITAEDGDGERTGRLFHLFVRSTLSIAGSPPASGVESLLYDANLEVHGGTGASYHWRLSGVAPPGITLRNAEGSSVELIGVLAAPGSWSFAVDVTDDNGGSAGLAVTISVSPRLLLVTDGFPSGLFGAEYRATASATGGSGAGYRWSVISGTLPPGLTLTADGATATIAGRPSAVGSFDFTLWVVVSSVEQATLPVRITIGENPPIILTDALPGATWSVDYAASISARSNAGGPPQWRLTAGSLPPGLTLSPGAGASASIAGTPKQRGTYEFTLAFSDAGGTASASYVLEVGALLRLEVLARIFGPARAGRAYSERIAASGAQGDLSWWIENGQLPQGLSLASDGAGAIVQGTPTQDGFYRFAVRASDSAGNTAVQRFAIHVGADRFWAAMAHTPAFSGPWAMTVRDLSGPTPGPAIDLLTNLISGDLEGVHDLQFSPDPSLFTFSAGDLDQKTLYLADLRGTPKAVKLGGRIRGDRGLPLRWSPDGTRFAYSTEPFRNSFQFYHYIMNVGGSPAATPIPAIPCEYSGVWSPDSTRYAVASTDGTKIFVADGTTTRTVELSPVRGIFPGVVAWTPDSAGLVFSGRDDGARPVRAYHLDLGVEPAAVLPLTPVGVDLNFNLFESSPDGASLKAVEGDGKAWVVDLRSPQLELARSVGAAWRALRWSPDSRQLALLRDATATAPAQLAAIERGGIGRSAPVVLAETDLPLQFANWTPDGERLLYGTESGVFAVPASGGAPDLLLAQALGGQQHAWLAGAAPKLIHVSTAGLLSAIDVSAPAPRTPAVLDETPGISQFVLAQTRKAVVYFRFGSGGAPGKVWMVDLANPMPAAPAELLDFGAGLVEYAVSE